MGKAGAITGPTCTPSITEPPTCTVSPNRSQVEPVTRWPLTKVPEVEPRSSIHTPYRLHFDAGVTARDRTLGQ